MTALGEARGHIGLKPHCGICGSSLKVDDRFVALLGNGDSTAYSHRTDAFIYPDHGHSIRRLNELLLCRRPGCRQCALSAESATLHADCFQLVLQEYGDLDNQLDNLWAATAWKSPWREVPHLYLEGVAITPAASICESLGLAQMRHLPPEIVHMIQVHSSSSLFWRYSAALSIVQRLSTEPADELISVPLHQVLAWTRGSQPAFLGSPSRLPIVRLTIDSDGVRKIERLYDSPLFRTWRTDRLAFVTLHVDSLRQVMAHFKFGLARLELPRFCPGLQLWDTPTPPIVDKCLLFSANITNSTQFHTIDLSRVTGLTFFYCLGEIYAIHAHTEQEPDAKKTQSRLSARHQRSVTWVYVPISPNDSIVAFGAYSTRSVKSFQKSTSLLLRFRLGGDVSVGVHYSKFSEDSIVIKSPPSMLIHEIVELQPVSVIGACPRDAVINEDFVPFQHAVVETVPFSNACYSTAPLNGVASLRVFYDDENAFCKGMLLEYSNGGKRALGQCRLGVDAFEHYDKPTHICLSHRTYRRQKIAWPLLGTMVHSTCDSSHKRDGVGWLRVPMTGELGFWFSDTQSKLIPAIKGFVQD